MNIKIECPSCKQRYSVDESIIGEEVECAACNKVFMATKKAPIKLGLPTIEQEKTPVPLRLPPKDEATHQSEYVYPWKNQLPLETEQNDSKHDLKSNHNSISTDECFCQTEDKQSTKKNNFEKKQNDNHSTHTQSWGRYIIAFSVCFVIFILYHLIAVLVFNWKNGGGLLPKIILFSVLVGIWKFICSKDEEGFEDGPHNSNKVYDIKLLKQAAERGDVDAQIKLGSCYYEGKNGVELSYTEAIKWFRKAAEQGNAEAQIMLAYCFENGKGVEKNYSETIKWCRMAAEQGNIQAQFKLAVLYSANDVNDQANQKEEIKWYRFAAEQGHAQAQLMLGLCFFLGNGVEKNIDEALKWIRLSASQGNKEAKDTLRKLGY